MDGTTVFQDTGKFKIDVAKLHDFMLVDWFGKAWRNEKRAGFWVFQQGITDLIPCHSYGF